MKNFTIKEYSIPGPYHIKNGIENQDRYITFSDENMIILIVADGAGSLKNSAKGADIAVNVALKFLQDNVDVYGNMGSLSEVVKKSVYFTSEVLKKLEEVGRLECVENMDQLGCTFTVAVLTESFFAVSVMGDALSVVKMFNEDFILVRPVKVGEFANLTKFLTSEDFIVESYSGETKNLEFVGLGSDGMDLSSIEKGVPVAGFWKKLVDWGKREGFVMKDFFNFLHEEEKIDDDTTLVMAVNSSTKFIENGSSGELVVDKKFDNEIIGSMLSDDYDFSKIDGGKLFFK